MKSKPIAGAAIGLLTLVSHSGAKTVGHEKYTYDASGNIVEKQIDDQVTRFEYEGNLLKADSTGTAYRHDRAGRLVAESGARGVERTLTYQFGDKVTRVENVGIASELLYNAEGQLVGKTLSGQTEILAWDGPGLVLRGQEFYANEAHVTGEVPVIGNNIDTIISDYLGNTLAHGGARFDGTAYGEGAENARFTGKHYEPGLEGFVFLHRTYIPEGGRWLTSDPSGFPDGSNNFAYVSGDPMGAFDKLGLTEVSYTATTLHATSSSNSPSVIAKGKYTWTPETGSPTRAQGANVDTLEGNLNQTYNGHSYTFSGPNTVITDSGSWRCIQVSGVEKGYWWEIASEASCSVTVGQSSTYTVTGSNLNNSSHSVEWNCEN